MGLISSITDLGSFFHKPFEPVGAFGGGNGNVQIKRAFVIFPGGFHNFHFGAEVIVIQNFGFVHISFSVGQVNRIAVFQAQHFAVFRFFFIEVVIIRNNIFYVEKVHVYNLRRLEL